MASAKCLTGKIVPTVMIQFGVLSPSGTNMPDRNRSGRIDALTMGGAASAFGMTAVIASARCIMRFALFQPFDTCTDNGSGRIEIRFTNFEVNDVLALPLQLVRPGKGFKCGFTLNSEHAFGNLTFKFCFHMCLT